MMEWTYCKDEMPVETGKLNGYLVTVGDLVSPAHFCEGKFWRDYLHQIPFDYPVRAWMLFPEPAREN